MSGPSSTSSSEPFGGGRSLRRTLAWCALFLVLVRVAFGFAGPDWRWQRNTAGIVAFLRAARDRDVRVLVLGSSRLKAAFDPSEWERLAGEPAGTVANATIAGGLIYDALYAVREGGLPASVRLVLIEVPRWNFNANALNPVTKIPLVPPDNLRQLGTLADRLAVDSPRRKLTLLGEWVWPLYQRRPLAAWIESWRRPGHVRPMLPRLSRHWRPLGAARAAANPHFEARAIAHDHFNDPQFSGFAWHNLTTLLALLEGRGARIVLVRVPVRPAYLEEARRDPAAGQLLDELDARLAKLGGNGVSKVECVYPQGCGLSEDIFTDYGHMRREGARAFTRWLFRRIEMRPPAP